MNKQQNEGSRSKSPLKVLLIVGGIMALLMIAFVLSIILSPKAYLVTTARWTEWNDSDRNDVVTAMGEENTEERFRLYFQYYNVIHELGHGIMRYNDTVDIPIADEEQLVNDFAVAYWNYYGDPAYMEELYDIVTYAVENVGDNAQNGVDYLELGREHSNDAHFDEDFFTFKDYGWFQFSSVKHSIEQNKSLDEVLKEMGLKNYTLPEPTLLEHKVINEEESTAIINEAVDNFHAWGLNFPKAYQSFNNDPNSNYSSPGTNYLGILDWIGMLEEQAN